MPGPTASEGANLFINSLAGQNNQTREQFEQEFFRSVRPSSLLRRFAQPEEVAAMAAFLCSPLSSATNGAAVRADGGVVRSIV
jgi:NAD(P)-dependent dehydrogenase (short-subunit alcohol dehydrogenase family)